MKVAELSDRGLSRRFLTDFLDFRFVRRPDLLAWSEKLLVRGSGNRAPHFHRGVAQLAERWSPKPEVASSIPAAPAIFGRGWGSIPQCVPNGLFSSDDDKD